ncbi:hypothetical protein AVEN_229034-1 [Araneus ventricosus]|uniref:Uncharacterized protein n=1 Tax=Araneus ventricosus TaxID=182803 RepID=A0A4Y2D0D3_ARAVE|nr:hypothetical protein AVEN_229034-1 [Araneus ventricosus]
MAEEIDKVFENDQIYIRYKTDRDESVCVQGKHRLQKADHFQNRSTRIGVWTVSGFENSGLVEANLVNWPPRSLRFDAPSFQHIKEHHIRYFYRLQARSHRQNTCYYRKYLNKPGIFVKAQYP